MSKFTIWKIRSWYNEKKQDEESDAILIFWGIVALVVIVLLWLMTMLIMMRWGENYRGTFGDMFGTINALFSGFAFAGIIFTILLQRKELKLQREELKDTRSEFIQQNSTLKLQRFENTFFNLLAVHREIVKSGETKAGVDLFEYAYNQLTSTLKEHGIKAEDRETEWNVYYLLTFKKHRTVLSKYFRNLYRMVLLVHETDLTTNENPSEEERYFSKYKYTSIIRAQLSDYELALLAYNCMTNYGVDKFKPLVEEYALLNNLPKFMVVPIEVTDQYEFGARSKKEF